MPLRVLSKSFSCKRFLSLSWFLTCSSSPWRSLCPVASRRNCSPATSSRCPAGTKIEPSSWNVPVSSPMILTARKSRSPGASPRARSSSFATSNPPPHPIQLHIRTKPGTWGVILEDYTASAFRRFCRAIRQQLIRSTDPQVQTVSVQWPVLGVSFIQFSFIFLIGFSSSSLALIFDLLEISVLTFF